ncbi:MAG: NUDIX hydrolase [Candidatus Giovannonibacteria bacterium GW2011_GWA2_53_7]|uniref:Oxidized purine nucleoside triphosphate hydrolase n=1 Tax=Candidatus Giovannonibacteria bacterium GW2011_GWA2_53_7 TaxID=1618650 RepID=A0A0G2AVU6_9BACT|nr:MAG: NUDIX hydrolase [Candidatus Giovannonibacteria bacterium GW2011_GWA2_53_7]
MNEEKVLFTATVCFPLRGDEVLLARKTRKIGAGCWNGYGGGPEAGESLLCAAVRELFEESSLRALPEDLEKVAIMDFHNTKTDGNVFVARVHFYMVNKWEGVPIATEEMADPTWFKRDELPLLEMMPADRILIPPVFAGKKVIGTAHYGPFQKELIGEVSYSEVKEFPEV